MTHDSLRTAAPLLAIFVIACAPSDIDPMKVQPKVKPYQSSAFFADGRAMRMPPPGAVSREQAAHNADAGNAAPTLADLELGQKRFGITCAACHGIRGDGESPVASKMAQRPPPSLLSPAIRVLPDATIHAVIRDGWGLMPPHGATIPPREIRATVAYLRALQWSQSIPFGQAPPSVQRTLRGAP